MVPGLHKLENNNLYKLSQKSPSVFNSTDGDIDVHSKIMSFASKQLSKDTDIISKYKSTYTNPDDIEPSYLNYPSKERGRRNPMFSSAYDENTLPMVKEKILENLGSLIKTHKDMISYLEELKYNPMIQNIDIISESVSSSKRAVRVSIKFIDNTEIDYNLLLWD